MLDFVDYLFIVVVVGISTVITMVLTRYQMDLAIREIDSKISGKMQTFKGSLARMQGTQREPSNTEVVLGLIQGFMAMKAEGYSISDIMKEFGGTVVEETIKEATKPTEPT